MILVFGKTGQVASELRSFNDVKALGREQADLSNLQACRVLFYFLSHKPLSMQQHTLGSMMESEESLAERINGEAPAAIAKACAELEIRFASIN